jgi:DNA-binding XRE family transcriptional regulator
MSFKCPYTEVCRAQALREFAEVPELAAMFAQRLQCGEQDVLKAQRCATLLGLAEQAFPTLGQYVQQQRRDRQLRQGELAAQVGLELQELRDLELNKLDPAQIAYPILEGLASALAISAAYLKSLARITTQAGTPRQGIVFARSIVPDEQTHERR